MSDTRMLVVSIVGTGLAATTVIVAFTAIIASGIDARFDDVNARFDDVDNRFDNVDSRFDNVNSRIDGVNRDADTRMDKIEADIRELRALLIEAIRGSTAAD